MLYAKEAWFRDGITRFAQSEACTRVALFKAFGWLADQANPIVLVRKNGEHCGRCERCRQSRWVDAVEKIGEEGASAALSDRLNLVYGALMRKDFSKIRRKPDPCKAEDGDIRRCVEELLSVLFTEEAVGTQPAASGKLS